MKAFEEKRDLADILAEQSFVTRYLSPKELKGLLDPTST